MHTVHVNLRKVKQSRTWRDACDGTDSLCFCGKLLQTWLWRPGKVSHWQWMSSADCET